MTATLPEPGPASQEFSCNRWINEYYYFLRGGTAPTMAHNHGPVGSIPALATKTKI